VTGKAAGLLTGKTAGLLTGKDAGLVIGKTARTAEKNTGNLYDDKIPAL